MTGRQGAKVRVKKISFGGGAPLEITGKGSPVRTAPSWSDEQLHLRTGAKAFGVHHIIERLYAETIARQKQFAAAGVVNREGEHALEMVDDLITPPRKSLQQRLSVARALPIHVR